MHLFKKTPPCPGNPEDYTLVESKEGMYWRKKRGTKKPAKINTALEVNVNATGIVSPAARRARSALRPYMEGIRTGRLNIRIGKVLRRALKEGKPLGVGLLKGIELQGEYPLNGLVTANYQVSVKGDSVRIEIPIASYSVWPLNPLVTDYYFEAVLLYGDLSKEWGLRTESVVSPLYSYRERSEGVCVLELDLPKEREWCLVLKLSSLEGKELAAHPKHYRMKVVEGSVFVDRSDKI
jgi:hypothetical protein